MDIQNHKHIYIYTIIKYQTLLYRITRDYHRLQTSQESTIQIAYRKIYMVTLYPFTTHQPKLSKPWIRRLETKKEEKKKTY